MKVLIVDYNCGNITSLKNALQHLGSVVQISADPNAINQADKIILPGVGSFGFGMENLRKQNLVHSLYEAVFGSKTPILGICLGAQLMLQKSQESSEEVGLGWINGEVKKIQPRGSACRVPHVGWNFTAFVKDSYFSDIDAKKIYYYTHSYYMDIPERDKIIAECSYAHGFAAVFNKDNIWGCQFHPEKSQKPGLDFLAKFLSI